MRSFLAFALCATAALAQKVLQFDSNPSDVQVGKPTNITYTLSNPNAPATITLRQGQANNLDTVEIITNDATGSSYSWTPSKSIVDGNDYALYISQGNDDNYSGRFAISGGADKPSNSSSSSSMNTTSSRTSTELPGGTLIAPGSGGRSNHTMASSGTGMSHMTRNATLSRATLTATTTISTSTQNDMSTAAAGFEGTRTGSSSTPSPTSGASAVIYGSSPLALVLCIFGAIMA